jgi:hypothetical protein
MGASRGTDLAVPDAALIFNLGVHADAVVDLSADCKGTARSAARGMHYRVRGQFTRQQDGLVGGRAATEKASEVGSYVAGLIFAAGVDPLPR